LVSKVDACANCYDLPANSRLICGGPPESIHLPVAAAAVRLCALRERYLNLHGVFTHLGDSTDPNPYNLANFFWALEYA